MLRRRGRGQPAHVPAIARGLAVRRPWRNWRTKKFPATNVIARSGERRSFEFAVNSEFGGAQLYVLIERSGDCFDDFRLDLAADQWDGHLHIAFEIHHRSAVDLPKR